MHAFDFPIPSPDWNSILPVLIVTITGILALIIEMIRPKHNNDLIVGVSLGGLVLAGAALVMGLGAQPIETMGEMFVRDQFGSVMQLLAVLSTALCILFSEPYLRQKRIAFGEFYPLALWATVGAMLMVSTKNLLMLFVGLEILSLALYVMAGMSRKEERSEESAMKYFLLGAFAGGFLLFGVAFLFGATGSLHLDSVEAVWRVGGSEVHALLVFAVALVLVGLGFKSSFVPFHQWTPDVYQGAPSNVTAFLATTSKIGAFGALWRFLDGVLELSSTWIPPLMVVAILTMLIGNLLALTQKDVKRILGYSSIANAGYVLVAMLAHAAKPDAIDSSALVYFLLAYVFTTAGAFAVISLTAREGKESTRVEDLRGLWKRSPLAALALLICILSLIGIPPTAGFVGKTMIFLNAIEAGQIWLAVVLAVSSAISVYYYLMIATAAFAGEEEAVETRIAKPGLATLGACALCAGGVIFAALLFGPLNSLLGR